MDKQVTAKGWEEGLGEDVHCIQFSFLLVMHCVLADVNKQVEHKDIKTWGHLDYQQVVFADDTRVFAENTIHLGRIL